jgi:hypothetical protein
MMKEGSKISFLKFFINAFSFLYLSASALGVSAQQEAI